MKRILFAVLAILLVGSVFALLTWGISLLPVWAFYMLVGGFVLFIIVGGWQARNDAPPRGDFYDDPNVG